MTFTTVTDASNYIFNRIALAADDSLLTVTLTRFAIYCANHPRNARMLEIFLGEFYLERVRLRHLAASARADEIRRIGTMIDQC